MMKRGKIVITALTVVMLIVIVGSLFVYFSNLFDLKTNNKTIKMESNIVKDIKTSTNTNDVNNRLEVLESEIIQLKTIIADKAVMMQPSVNFVIKDEFSGILLTSMMIEKKLNEGGNILNDIIKLKAFSVNIPEVLFATKTFENVRILKSKNDLISEFNNFVRSIKSSRLEQQGIWCRILSFISRYITILNTNNEQDASLVRIESLIKEGEFFDAFEVLSSLKLESESEAKFIEDLQKSAEVKQGIDSIYTIIQMNLNSKH